MKVRRSRLEVLTILDFVDLWGADAASEKYGVDSRTLKRWQDREPSGWQREEEVNRLLQIEKRVAGKVSYRDAVVGAGVAADKLWRMADRAARALRHEQAEQPPEPERSPTQEQTDRLDDSRRGLFAAELDHELHERADHPDARPTTSQPLPSEEESLTWLTAEVDRLLALSDEEVAARRGELSALEHVRQETYMSERRAEWEQRATPAKPSAPAEEPVRLPTARVDRSKPVPQVIDVREPDHDRGWHPYERREF